MKAYDMSRHQRVIGTDGRISGTWIALQASSRAEAREVLIKANDVTIYDEAHRSGRCMYSADFTAWVRDGVVDLPMHMVREEIRADVEDARAEIDETLKLIAEVFLENPHVTPATP